MPLVNCQGSKRRDLLQGVKLLLGWCSQTGGLITEVSGGRTGEGWGLAVPGGGSGLVEGCRDRCILMP